jgi:hypothetical protein
MKVNRPGHVLLVLGAFFMFLDTLFAWQAVEVGRLTYTRNAWHGFWGVILGLMTIVFLVNAAAQTGVLEFKLPFPRALLSIALAPAILVFAVIKTISDHNSGWASYLGIVLAGVITIAAWLARNKEKAEKRAKKDAAAHVPAPKDETAAPAEPSGREEPSTGTASGEARQAHAGEPPS